MLQHMLQFSHIYTGGVCLSVCLCVCVVVVYRPDWESTAGVRCTVGSAWSRGPTNNYLEIRKVFCEGENLKKREIFRNFFEKIKNLIKRTLTPRELSENVFEYISGTYAPQTRLKHSWNAKGEAIWKVKICKKSKKNHDFWKFCDLL
jgi:hypothetical protein